VIFRVFINLKNCKFKFHKVKEGVILNRGIARIISEQGHQDLLMVVDAGFAIPKEVEVVDISLSVNNPMVLTVLAELKRCFSVEKIIMAKETKETSPSLFDAISQSFGANMPVETIDHANLKQLAKTVKAIIRTGDFTAYGNVILVSGAGERWYYEK
jgi:D-ribose pyranase